MPSEGAGAAVPTADEVLAGRDLRGRVVVVTGASGGLGLEVARAVAARGASLVLVARDPDRSAAAAATIRASVPGAALEMCRCDVASLAAVRAAAAEILRRHRRVDVLVNNAGIMAVPLARTGEGFELQLATNHVGPFLLTALLRPALAAAGRVVNVASRGHRISDIVWDDPHFLRSGYDRWTAYGQSKTANILTAVELTRRWADDGVAGVAVHPGMAPTRMAAHLERADLREMAARLPGGPSPLKTTPQAAASICWAAFADETARGAAYVENCRVSGPADPPEALAGHAAWATDPEHATELWERTERWIAAGRP